MIGFEVLKAAAKDRRITEALLRVLILLAAHADNDTGICWPRKKTLAKELGVTKQAVGKSLRKLSEAGFLTIIPQKNARTGADDCNVYKITTPQPLEVTPGQPSEVTPLQPLDIALPATFTGSPPGQPSEVAPLNSNNNNSHSNSESEGRPPAKPKATKTSAKAIGTLEEAEEHPLDGHYAEWFATKAPGLDRFDFREGFVLQCRSKGYKYDDYWAAMQKWARADQKKLDAKPKLSHSEQQENQNILDEVLRESTI